MTSATNTAPPSHNELSEREQPDARGHDRPNARRRARRPFFRGRQPVPEVSRLLPAGRPRPAQDRQEIHHDGPQPHSRRRDDGQSMARVRRSCRPATATTRCASPRARPSSFTASLKVQSARGHQGHQRIAALHARRVRRREPQCARPAHARLHQGARTGLCRLPAGRAGARAADPGLSLHLD